MTKNSNYIDWCEAGSYFDLLAVLSDGPLHPGGTSINSELASRFTWGDTVTLDIGSGSGWAHRFFSSLGASVYNIEPNSYMREVARNNGVPDTRLIGHAAHHFHEAKNYLPKTIDRVLMQGVAGFLENGLPDISPYLSYFDVKEVIIVDWISGEWVKNENVPIRNSYSLGEYTTWCELSGFTLINAESRRCFSPTRMPTEEVIREKILRKFPESSEIDGSEAGIGKAKEFFEIPRVSEKVMCLISARRE